MLDFVRDVYGVCDGQHRQLGSAGSVVDAFQRGAQIVVHDIRISTEAGFTMRILPNLFQGEWVLYFEGEHHSVMIRRYMVGDGLVATIFTRP